MKTDPNGGPAAEGELDARLARLYDGGTGSRGAGLPGACGRRSGTRGERAPNRPRRLRLAAAGPRGHRGGCDRGCGRMAGRSARRLSPARTGPSQRCPGADGIPNQIDGQHVYRIADRSEWQNLSGSFLLGGDSVPRGALLRPAPGRTRHLVLRSETYSRRHAARCWSGRPRIRTSCWRRRAPPWSGLAWRTIVMRVHTHDPEAAQCSAEDHGRSAKPPSSVEAVVWPTVPTRDRRRARLSRRGPGLVPDIAAASCWAAPFTKPDVHAALPDADERDRRLSSS